MVGINKSEIYGRMWPFDISRDNARSKKVPVIAAVDLCESLPCQPRLIKITLLRKVIGKQLRVVSLLGHRGINDGRGESGSDPDLDCSASADLADFASKRLRFSLLNLTRHPVWA